METAILRLAEVVASSAQGRAAEEHLQVKIAELEKKSEEMRRAALKAEAEARHLTDRREAEARIIEADRLRREAEHNQREGQIELDTLRRTLLHDVLAKTEPLIRALAEERGLDLVQLAPNPGLAYFNPKLDITDEIIRRLNDVDRKAPSSGTKTGQPRTKG